MVVFLDQYEYWQNQLGRGRFFQGAGALLVLLGIIREEAKSTELYKYGTRQKKVKLDL